MKDVRLRRWLGLGIWILLGALAFAGGVWLRASMATESRISHVLETDAGMPTDEESLIRLLSLAAMFGRESLHEIDGELADRILDIARPLATSGVVKPDDDAPNGFRRAEASRAGHVIASVLAELREALPTDSRALVRLRPTTLEGGRRRVKPESTPDVSISEQVAPGLPKGRLVDLGTAYGRALSALGSD